VLAEDGSELKSDLHNAAAAASSLAGGGVMLTRDEHGNLVRVKDMHRWRESHHAHGGINAMGDDFWDDPSQPHNAFPHFNTADVLQNL
jgi:hypothetical protein